MKIIYYATPKDEIPLLNGEPIGFYYALNEKDEAVVGTEIDKTMRAAVNKFTDTRIVQFGSIG